MQKAIQSKIGKKFLLYMDVDSEVNLWSKYINTDYLYSLYWYGIYFWIILTSQYDTFQICWKNALGPLVSCGEGLWWSYYH